MNSLRELTAPKRIVCTTSHTPKVTAAAILCLAVFSSSPSLAKEGSEKQLQAIKKLAEKGDIDEQLWLGRINDPDVKENADVSGGRKKKKKEQSGLHRYSFSVTKSYPEALKWYELAANGGNKAAQSRLGDMYFDQGTGLGDYAKAALWYAKVAGPDYLGALNRLGWMYELGKGVVQNNDKAWDFYITSAKGGFSGAQYNVGLIVEFGKLGIGVNLLDAAEWYRLAHDNGDKGAGERLAAVKNSLTPQQSIELAQFETQRDGMIAQQAEQARAQEAAETRAAETAAEDDEPIPSTAAIIAGALGNIAGQVGQMRQNQAQAAEQLRQLKQQQADAQRRSQEQAQQQAAEQRLAQQQAALQRSQQQAASQRQQQEQNADAAQAPVASYQPQCIRAEVSHERQCTSGSNITLRVVSVCSAPMNARFCVQRANGTWECGEMDGVSTGPIASTNALQYVCDGTGQTKVWMRTPLQGGWVPWPEP